MQKKSVASTVIQRFKSNGPWNAGKFDFEQAWEELNLAIDQIYLRNSSELSFEILYRHAYNMVLAKKGDFLYKSVTEKIIHFVTNLADRLANTVNEELLKQLCFEWDYYKIVMGMMRDILLYVDRNYCKNQLKLPVYSLALQIYRENLIYHPNIRGRLRKLLLDNIETERNGGVIDRDIMRTILTMYQDISVDISSSRIIFVYEEEFEAPFLDATRDFYHAESNAFIAQNPVSEYLRKVEQRLKQEQERIHHYVSSTSDMKLKAVLDQELISCHVYQLLDMQDGTIQPGATGSACVALLRDDKLDDLKRLYMLLSRVPSTLDSLRECIGEYTRQSGLVIIQQLLSSSSTAAAASSTASSSSAATSAAATSASTATPASTSVPASAIATVSSETTLAYMIPLQFVQQVLELQSKLDSIINNAFNTDKKAQQKQQDAFDYFINYNEASPTLSKPSSYYNNIGSISSSGFCAASYLAIYIDDILKNSNRGVNADISIDNQIDQAMIIFRHLADKDLFEYFYKQHLSKRLLQSKTINDDAERLVVARLKTECGYQYTSKLEGMFKDMQMSKTMMDEYHTHLSTSSSKVVARTVDDDINTSSTIELDIQILTAGYWPLQTIPPCRLPPSLSSATDDFLSYYLRKNNGKKLTWLLHLGSVDMKVSYPSGRRELNVSTYQACMLLCFNEHPVWSLSDLQRYCDIPELEFKRHLLSLCTSKLRILRKSSTGKGLLPDDSFTCNTEFTSKFKRIKVPLIALKEVSHELSEQRMHDGVTPSTVEEDRKNSVDASIVRIMKARKRLAHNELIAEVSKQLSNRFNPNPMIIKNRIESLIERDYLERDTNDMRTYNYLA